MRFIHIEHNFSIFSCVNDKAINPFGVFKSSSSVEKLLVAFVLNGAMLGFHFWRKSMQLFIWLHSKPVSLETSQELITIIFIGLIVGLSDLEIFLSVQTWSLNKCVSWWFRWRNQDQVSRKKLIFKNFDHVSNSYLWPFLQYELFRLKTQSFHLMV